MQNGLVLRERAVAYHVVHTQTPPYHLDPPFIVRVVVPSFGTTRLAQAKVLHIWDRIQQKSGLKTLKHGCSQALGALSRTSVTSQHFQYALHFIFLHGLTVTMELGSPAPGRSPCQTSKYQFPSSRDPLKMLCEIYSPFLCTILSESATLYLTSNVFFGFFTKIFGLTVFFGELGNAVVGMGTRRRRRQKNRLWLYREAFIIYFVDNPTLVSHRSTHFRKTICRI